MATTYDTLEMGPCSITFKGADLGLTKGGVEVTFGTEVATVNADQFGDTAIDQVIKGRSVKVKIPMAERDLTKLAAVIPGSTLVGTTAKKLMVNASVGTSLRALAGALVIHPYAVIASDKTKDVHVALAMCKGDFQFAYQQDQQRVYTVEFEGFVDLATGLLFTMGDPLQA